MIFQRLNVLIQATILSRYPVEDAGPSALFLSLIGTALSLYVVSQIGDTGLTWIIVGLLTIALIVLLIQNHREWS